jgi:carbon storage regulator
MLVLSRKIGERIVIGDGIVVTVLQVDGRKVRIGIDAPSDVPVFRRELIENNSKRAFERVLCLQ